MLRAPCRCAPRTEEAKIFAAPHGAGRRLELEASGYTIWDGFYGHRGLTNACVLSLSCVQDNVERGYILYKNEPCPPTL
eukprot:3296537-Prymnesium_polylepis.1